MDVDALVTLLMGALLTVAGRAGEGALEAAGDAAKDTAGSVVERIRSRWSRDESAAAELERFVAEPDDDQQAAVQSRLTRELTAEPELRDELSTLVEGAGPQIEVFQRLAEAHGVTGARVEEAVGGSLRVTQNIEHALDVTGADIKRMG
jgi:hypothetical protein